MISTLQIKQQQLVDGYFSTGTGSEKMLIMGSCRVAPYVWYVQKLNEEIGNRFTIYSIDPFSWNWDINENRVDYSAELIKQETNEKLLSMLGSVSIFCHEYYKNAEMFNCDKTADKNIYQYNLKPGIDICIPSWNDVFVLFADIAKFDVEIRKKVDQDFNVLNKLSDQTQKEMVDLSQANLEKFYKVCRLSDLPEMEHYFLHNYRRERLFWTYNHISRHFTLKVFSLMNEKVLKLDLPDEFWYKIYNDDLFANNFTKLSEYDVKHFGYEWGESIVPLKELL